MADINIDVETRNRIGNLWVKLMEDRVKDGTINASESAVLMRLLAQSGYTLDPTRLPVDLRGKLTENMDLNDPATRDELGILPMKKKRA